MKRCKKCQVDKRVGEFYTDRWSVDGRVTTCKACKKVARCSK